MTIFAGPSEWTRAIREAAFATPFADGTQHYFAFISYSHRDEKMGEWLQDALEDFRVPSHLVGRVTEHGSVPKRLKPIFRDLSELPASNDLGTEIRSALAASRFLVVLCSPSAAVSRWTNAEIEVFKRVRPDGCVLAVILDGEPFASDIPGREAEECLPQALRFKYDRRGRQTAKRSEPLAADIRGDAHAKRMGFLKLVAGMLGVGLDDLVRREEVRRHRHLALVTAASLVGMLIATGLAVAAIQARDAARDQRREAEGLIGFMIGDLRAKLEPVGRLDALDGVGERVLDYYKKQDMSDLSDAALLQRSRALSLMGEIANASEDSAGALRQYRAALVGTGEAVRRKPNDPQRLFEHAQNIFWVGELARQGGQFDEALRSFQQYEALAARMVALDPDNMRWRMETQYADANLGIVLVNQRKFEEAVGAFQQALSTITALASADPSNADYKKGRVEVLAWLADARSASGRLKEAAAVRKQQIQLLDQLVTASGGDVEFLEDRVHAFRALGHIYNALGLFPAAEANFQSAVDQAQTLVGIEPGNRMWAGFVARSRLDLADGLLASGNVARADAAARAGCTVNDALLARDASVLEWRLAKRDCLALRTQVALAEGQNAVAVQLADQAVQSAQAITRGDAIENKFYLAKAQRLLGESKLRGGDTSGAGRIWQAALASLPASVAEKPVEMNEHAQLLMRVGKTAQARPLQDRLAAMGFKQAI